MEQNKYQHSDKLPLSLVVEELEKDAEFTDKALQILSVEDRGYAHLPMKAVSVLIDHWLVNRDLNCYIDGKLVDDVTALTVLPVDGDYGAGIEALENWMTIRKDELAALLEQRNLSVPAFLKVSKAPPPGGDEEQAADAPAAKVEAVPVTSPGGDDWEVRAREIADKIALERWGNGIREITARNICDAVAIELAKDVKNHGNRGPRSSGAVRSVALKGWKFIPPAGTNGTSGTNE